MPKPFASLKFPPADRQVKGYRVKCTDKRRTKILFAGALPCEYLLLVRMCTDHMNFGAVHASVLPMNISEYEALIRIPKFTGRIKEKVYLSLSLYPLSMDNENLQRDYVFHSTEFKIVSNPNQLNPGQVKKRKKRREPL